MKKTLSQGVEGEALNLLVGSIPYNDKDEQEKVKLNLNIGLKDKFFLKESGIENRASISLAIGVENVIK